MGTTSFGRRHVFCESPGNWYTNLLARAITTTRIALRQDGRIHRVDTSKIKNPTLRSFFATAVSGNNPVQVQRTHSVQYLSGTDAWQASGLQHSENTLQSRWMWARM